MSMRSGVANAERRDRRRGDRRLIPSENWYRDVWLLVISVFVFVALHNASNAINQQREGRRVAVAAICGATSAVIEAGRATITGGAAGVNGEFERNLRKLGYPPRKVRRKQAMAAAEGYARTIAEGVRTAAGVKAHGLVRADGTLDCHRLQRVARTR